MPNYLYKKSDGTPVASNSYSAGAMFSDCPTKYDYNKRQGWREKDRKAATQFGVEFESALQSYHEYYDIDLTLREWFHLWGAQKGVELVYKDSESWEDMYQQGLELLRLYAVLLPSLPIDNPQFQLNYRKELFPGTEYAGIEDNGYVDMVVEVPPDHKLLPPPLSTDIGGFDADLRKVLIDIKTSGKRYPMDSRLLQLDAQLRRYSWQSGIETVAFLVFVRHSRKLDRGDVVTLLEDTGNEGWDFGAKVVIFDGSEDGEHVNLMAAETFAAYKAEAKDVRGNALKAIKARYLEETFEVRRKTVTNQEIQFLAANISEKQRFQAGEQAGREALSIYEADRADYFPQHPGIRFPSNHCIWCSYLGLCLDDQDMVAEKLVNISGVVAKEPDWLDDLSEEE